MKKAMIINCIELGMELEKAYILCELQQEEIEKLENDTQFVGDIEVLQIILEKQLLERHAEAIQIALEKGNSKPIEWMLSKINPDRWGSKKDNILIPGKLVITEDDKALL